MDVEAILDDARLAPHLSPAAKEALREILRDHLGGGGRSQRPVPAVRRVAIDGACSGNPGPGGWAVVFEDGPVIVGGEDHTTSSRMELRGAIAALERMPDEPVEIQTDSALVFGLMTQDWNARSNLDLVSRLKTLAITRAVTWTKVQAHAGHDLNTLADKAAAGEAQRRRARLASA